jgi:YD repeat-containing protein
MSAQGVRDCGTTSLGTYRWLASGQVTKTTNCPAVFQGRCYTAESTAWSVEKTSASCDPVAGSCGVKVHVTATLPGLRDMIANSSLSTAAPPWVEWYPCSAAGCTKDIVCGLDAFGGKINFDNLDIWLERGLSCTEARALTLSAKIRVCANVGSCEKPTMIDIPPLDLAQALGCPVPLPNTCSEGSGGADGAAGTACPLCQPVGGEAGCSVPVGGGGPSCAPSWLGKARLRYAAGGVGGDGLPGSTAWRTALGRFWVHDYAEHIVTDPDTSHVWLLTRNGSFREFSNLVAGSGLRLYQGRSPADEFRKLYFDTDTGGWQLHALDGRKDYFLSDGRWDKTTFAQDAMHPVQATYNASNQLVSMSFPDGRNDTFTYHPGGKLASITEVAVAGSGTPSRTWSFTWSGDELTLATRPDATTWQFFYDPARQGYLTRVDLVSGPLGRVMAAFEYQAGSSNVVKSW